MRPRPAVRGWVSDDDSWVTNLCEGSRTHQRCRSKLSLEVSHCAESSGQVARFRLLMVYGNCMMAKCGSDGSSHAMNQTTRTVTSTRGLATVRVAIKRTWTCGTGAECCYV